MENIKEHRREMDALNLIGYEVQDGIAVLTLNDPPANTYRYEML